MPELIQMPTLFGHPNLVSYWRFEGNSNDSKGLNNGTDTAVTYGSSYGIFGQGVLFDSISDKISIGNPVNLQITGSITVNCWMRWTTTSLPTIRHTNFLGKGGYPSAYNTDWCFARNYSVGGIFFAISNNTQSKQCAVPIASDATMGTSWHMLTGVYVAGTSPYVAVYLDGKFVNQSGLNAPTAMLGTYNINFGDDPNKAASVDGWQYGNLDEVSIFNAALSAQYILEMYNGYAKPNLLSKGRLLTFVK